MMRAARSLVIVTAAELLAFGVVSEQVAADSVPAVVRRDRAIDESRLLALQDPKESPKETEAPPKTAAPPKEAPKAPEPSKDPVEARSALFRSYDANQDGLSPDEYLKGAGIPEAGQPVARRNFAVVDFDKSGSLSREEFFALPGGLPPRLRGPVPDPVTDMFTATLQVWSPLHKKADADADGRLSAEDWKKLEFPADLEPFRDVPFTAWDADSDGAVTADEGERLLAVAYGIRHPDGTLLRLPSAVHYFGSFLRPLDKDGDLALSADELVAGYWGGREKSLALFKDLDADADQKLTAAEIMRTQPLTVDVLGAFLTFDKDLDGRLSPEELKGNASTGATPLGIEQTMKSFDDDRDGHLSLKEFQLAPLGYGYVTLRVSGRADVDHDAALSWTEFYAEKSPMLLGLAWELFRRYDRNHDGKLELDEFEFRIDPSKVPVEKLLAAKDKDKNGQLVLDELFLEASPPEGNEQARLRFAERGRYWQNWIEFADLDGNEALSLAEYRFGMTQFPEAVYGRFAKWDTSGEGALTAEEFLAAAEKPDEPLVRRNFRVLDFDGSGGLSWREFRSYPGQLPTNRRGRVPDVAADLGTRALKEWTERKQQADANQDGKLSEEERAKLVLPEELAPFRDLSLAAWDADGDGQISTADAERLFAIAYGLRQKEGTPLRLPTGIICYGSFVRSCDKDRDEVLTSDELGAVYWGGKERAAALFQQLDADADQKLTADEIMRTQPLTVDLLSAFLTFDKDLDGRVSPEELKGNASTGATPLGIEQTMKSFDDDRDGHLSLKEFQLAPLGYGYVTLRVHGRTDLDHDAALSWSEFYVEKSPVLLGLAWELFQRYDRNRDGRLELDEFEFRIDPSKIPVEKLFLARDANRNQKWEKEEFLAYIGSTPQALRNFRLADADGDQSLNIEELRMVPGFVPVDQRLVPDPAAELAAKAVREWTDLAGTAEMKSISSRSWPGLELERRLGPLGALKVSVWDTNRDGQVDATEAERLIAIAYGLQRPDGTPLRRPNGLVLFSAWLDRIDTNRDGNVTATEFVPQFWQERSKSQELFAKLDEDRDDRLSYADFWKTPAISIDTYGAFLYLDKDLNGLIGRKELLEGKSSGANEESVEQMFPAFDENGDDQLSLREFRLLPIGMGYITYDLWGRQDADNSGGLSWKEFFKKDEPPLMGLAWELFRRLDRDKDGQLGIDEFKFQFDPAKLPVEVEFRIADRNQDGKVDFLEVFRDPKPDQSNGPEFKRYQIRLARAEDKFQFDDKDRNGWLALEEFSEARKAAVAVAERHRRATGRLSNKETRDWFLPVFLTVDVFVLAGVGWFVLRRRAG